MKHGIAMVALSALLWIAPALGQPVSQGESDASQRHPVLTKPGEGVHQDAGQADESQLLPSASLEYTIAVIALGGLGLLVSIGILCMPAPTLERKQSDR